MKFKILSLAIGIILLALSIQAQADTIDTTAPAITIIKPLENSFTKDSRTQIQASLSDDNSGIDISSLEFKIQGASYALGDFATHSLQLSAGSSLTFTPKFDFNNMQTLAVRIDLNDFAENKAVKEWSFTVDRNAAEKITSLDGDVQGNESIGISWIKPGFEGADISYYKVYRNTAPIPSETSRAAFFYAQTANTFLEDFTIEKGRTFYYYVTSVDNAGNESLLSNEKSIQVNGFVQTSADQNIISMEEGTSFGIEITLFNDTKSVQDIRVRARSDDSDLIVESAVEELRLNRNESTSFALSINAQGGVRTGSHDVEVRTYYSGLETVYTVKVQVGSSNFVSFEVLDSVVCNENYTVKLPVEVSNISGTSRTIRITASNSTFLPSWEDSEPFIRSGESKTINLLLHTTPSSEITGEYTVQVSARSSSDFSVGELVFNIEDCEESGVISISLSTTTSTIDLRKGETRTISYTVSNNSSSDTYVDISVETDLSADYNSLLFVRGNRSITEKINVRTGIFQEPKTYDLKIKAAAENEVKSEKTVKVRLLATHYFEFSGLEQDFDIKQGEEKTVQIEFKNADYNESFTLELEAPAGITASLSQSSFTMQPRTVKRVDLTVKASESASLGSKTLKVKAKTGNVSQKTLEVRLNVKEKTLPIETPETALLEIESYPLKVQLNPGESKEISFVIYNPSKTGTIASVSLEGLPEGVSFDEILESIPAKSRITVSGELKASASAEIGEFEIPIRVSAFGLSQTKHFTLIVGQQGFFAGLISGFLSLGESVWLGVIALVVIIALLMLLGKAAGTGKPKEAWVERKY